MQLTPGKRRLEQVGGIHRAIGFTGTDERMHLSDEQDDRTGGFGHFGQNGLEAFF